MAIVPNKDGAGVCANGLRMIVDPSYESPTVYAAGVPTTASLFVNEVRADTATGERYNSQLAGSTQWLKM